MRNPMGRVGLLLLAIVCPVRADDAPRAWEFQSQQGVADAEYEISRTGAAWQSPNIAQGFTTHFGTEGILLVSGTAEVPAWEWGLTLLGIGRPGAVVAVEPALQRVDGQRIEYDRRAVLEWYVNDARGLEQGFTLEAPPSLVRGAVSVELALEGTLDPVFSADGQAVDFKIDSGAVVLRYSQLAVFDATGERLPARMDGFAAPEVRGIRITFDDTAAIYPVTVDPLATTAAWTAESNQASAGYGYSLAPAGDVNGDGYSDVIVGAPAYYNGQTTGGRAFVYLGSASGLAVSAAWITDGDQFSASYGHSVASAGDVNGDGYADVIVGAPRFDNGEVDEGRAYLYLGSAAGLATTPAWTVEGNQAGANYGTSVAGAGDVNGDGFADVVVGASSFDNGQLNEGRAFLYLGSAAGLATIPVWVAEADQANAAFGTQVASAGDVNADGFADLIVGAPQYDNPNSDEGRAYVFLGSASGPLTTAAWSAEGDQDSAEFGVSVSTAGDVNGDGYADVIVGAHLFNGALSDAGKAYLYLGSAAGLAAIPTWTQTGNRANGYLGNAVATAGDINCDGYADVILGHRAYNNGQLREGRAIVYFGSGTGLVPSTSWTTESNQLDGNYGKSVATAGDVNGDGCSDVVVGADLYDNGQSDEGRAYLYLGSPSTLAADAAWTAQGGQDSAHLGMSVATAGDVDGDGYSDVLVSAPDYNNAHEDAGRVELFRGSFAGLVATPAWTAEGTEDFERLGSSVASAGDVDGDGYADILVGAYAYGNNSGRVLLYRGSATGMTSIAAWSVSGSPDSGFGKSVSTAGDVNGDGYADVIVGAAWYTAGEALEGRASVYLGSATGLAATPAWSVESNTFNARFGNSVATAGDVNGDGYADVIVGAPGFDSFEGRAFLYLGSAAGLTTTPAWTANGTAGESFGSSVATAGDVNGDGYADVVVGSPLFSNGQNQEGRAYGYMGSASGLGATAAWTRELNVATSWLGTSIGTGGDVDGDGYADVIVGAPGYSADQAQEGQAYVHLGSATGIGIAIWAVQGNQDSAALGQSVAGAGDVNGDGFSDVVIGASHYANGENEEGHVYVFYGGGDGGGIARSPRQLRSDETTPVAAGGKSDSESEFYGDLRGRTPAGRGRVRALFEVKALGLPFDGAGLTASPLLITGAPDAEGSAVALGASIGGLTQATAYHWRVRTVSPDPFFQRSRWISIPGNNATEKKLRTAGCVDADGDGYGVHGDASCASVVPDCSDSNAAWWALPGETRNLRFISKVTLIWDAPADPGANLTDLVYDTLVSDNAADFTAPTCLESDDGSDTTATEIVLPLPNQTFFYLIRTQNACPPDGLGSLGTLSGGVERSGADCS